MALGLGRRIRLRNLCVPRLLLSSHLRMLQLLRRCLRSCLRSDASLLRRACPGLTGNTHQFVIFCLCPAQLFIGFANCLLVVFLLQGLLLHLLLLDSLLRKSVLLLCLLELLSRCLLLSGQFSGFLSCSRPFVSLLLSCLDHGIRTQPALLGLRLPVCLLFLAGVRLLLLLRVCLLLRVTLLLAVSLLILLVLLLLLLLLQLLVISLLLLLLIISLLLRIRGLLTPFFLAGSLRLLGRRCSGSLIVGLRRGCLLVSLLRSGSAGIIIVGVVEHAWLRTGCLGRRGLA